MDRPSHSYSLTSSVGTLGMIADAVREAGLGNVRSQLRLSPGINSRSRVSHDVFTRAFMSLEAANGDEGLGLQLAMHTPLRAFNAAIYAFLTSPTLGVGLEHLARFQSIHTLATQLHIRHEDDRIVVQCEMTDGALRTTRTQREFYLALIWRYMQWQTGLSVAPIEVRLRGRQVKAAAYEAFFGCPVRFGQGESALVISRERWNQPSIHACPEVFETVRQLAELQLSALGADRTEAKVRLALGDLAEGGVADLKSVARRLNMSTRTIQRRLAAEGVSFQQLIAHHQLEQARRLLAGTRAPIAEIADACGFTARRSFYRAFERWTGQTPAAFRRSTQLEAPLVH